ncbi:MAG TPA: hypothetical protein VI299_10985, partial [Polyangiales bacterium]
RHDESATARLTVELTRFREEVAFYDAIGARALSLGFARAAQVARAKRIIQLNLAFCIARDLLGRRPRDGAQKLGLFRDLFGRQRVS